MHIDTRIYITSHWMKKVQLVRVGLFLVETGGLEPSTSRM